MGLVHSLFLVRVAIGFYEWQKSLSEFYEEVITPLCNVRVSLNQSNWHQLLFSNASLYFNPGPQLELQPQKMATYITGSHCGFII